MLFPQPPLPNNNFSQSRRVCRRRTYRDGSFTTLYNLEMISALAFRLKSHKAEAFRGWIVRQAISPVVLWQIPHAEALPS
jgi:hypothetical protein